MSGMFPLPYRFQSENTKFFAISTPGDKVDQEVDTKPGNESIPDDSVLFTNPPIGDEVSVVEITGLAPSRLYVSLKRDADRTKLTWSDKKYLWVVHKTNKGTYVITPANGADLFWFDEFNVGVGNHIEVRKGSDIKPPQNEWVITPA